MIFYVRTYVCMYAEALVPYKPTFRFYYLCRKYILQADYNNKTLCLPSQLNILLAILAIGHWPLVIGNE